MKGLLHSKLFKKNLLRWLFMYVTVIGLFTSVVTYSKYISSMQGGDTAKVAKFDASITYDGVCAGIEEEQICDSGTFRPTSQISYYFTVDTTDLEVSTIFVTRISVSEVFKNIKIYDVTETETGTQINDLGVNYETNNNGKYNYNVYTLTENLKASDTYIRKYKITMNFDYENYIEDSINGAVKVGYSATQIK